MKTKSILILIFFFIQFNSVAQETDFGIQKSIYEKAKSYNDPNVAISALYNMIAIQPMQTLDKINGNMGRDILKLSSSLTYHINQNH